MIFLMEKKLSTHRKTVPKIFLSSICISMLLLIGAIATGIIYWNWYLPNALHDRRLPCLREQFDLDDIELKIRRSGNMNQP